MKVILLLVALVASVLAAPSSTSSGHSPPQTRIVGGQDAARFQYPYQISLQRRGIVSFSHMCGGSILTHNWIVSAAHCTTNAASTYRVVAGILDLNENTSERQEALVSFIVNHPDYKPPANGVAPHDISLIQLDRSLQWTHAVRPVSLPTPHFVASGDAELSGWGSIGGSIWNPTMPNRLQQALLPIVGNAECRRALDAALRTPNHPFDDASNMCSGPLTGGQSACNGDSGGPLVQHGLLVGIVSWGLTPCGSVGAPSVYAKAANYVDWIRSFVPEV